jgi:hypothetical protein
VRRKQACATGLGRVSRLVSIWMCARWSNPPDRWNTSGFQGFCST